MSHELSGLRGECIPFYLVFIPTTNEIAIMLPLGGHDSLSPEQITAVCDLVHFKQARDQLYPIDSTHVDYCTTTMSKPTASGMSTSTNDGRLTVESGLVLSDLSEPQFESDSYKHSATWDWNQVYASPPQGTVSPEGYATRRIPLTQASHSSVQLASSSPVSQYIDPQDLYLDSLRSDYEHKPIRIHRISTPPPDTRSAQEHIFTPSIQSHPAFLSPAVSLDSKRSGRTFDPAQNDDSIMQRDRGQIYLADMVTSVRLGVVNVTLPRSLQDSASEIRTRYLERQKSMQPSDIARSDLNQATEYMCLIAVCAALSTTHRQNP